MRSRGTIPIFTLVVDLVAIVLIIGSGGGCTVGGGTVDIAVFTPGLSSPLVIVFVVPFVVGLSRVSLGVGLAVRLRDGEVLVATILVVALGVGSSVLSGTLLGGSLVMASGLVVGLGGRVGLLGGRVALVRGLGV